MKIIEQLEESIGIILGDIERYNNIIDRSTYLSEFDALNRMLIEMQMQGSRVRDLKTESQWKVYGRKVADRTKAITIVIPSRSFKYIDNETGKTVDISELSAVEIKQALNYNIMHKESKIESVKEIQVYDIGNTYELKNGGGKYKEPAPIKVEKALEILKRVTGATIMQSSNTYYDLESNIIGIAGNQGVKLYNSISSFLVQYMIRNILVEIVKDTNKNGDVERLLEYSLTYSIESLLRHKTDEHIESSVYSSIDVDTKLNIIYLVDNMINIIYDKMAELGLEVPQFKADVIENSIKAEKIVNILLANDVKRKYSSLLSEND